MCQYHSRLWDTTQNKVAKNNAFRKSSNMEKQAMDKSSSILLGNDEYKGEKQISNQGENVLWAILEQGSPFFFLFFRVLLEYGWFIILR